MKKIFALSIFVFAAIHAVAQPTVRTRPTGWQFMQQGNSTTWTQNNGIVYPVVGFAPPLYADTTAANATDLDQVGLCLISTSSDGKWWRRNWALTKWEEVAVGTLPTPTFQQVLTAGSTLTTNNTINVGGYNFTISNSGQIEIFSTEGGNVVTGALNRSAITVGDNILIYPHLGSLIIDTLNAFGDTINWKPLVYRQSTGEVKKATYWPGGGGGGSSNLTGRERYALRFPGYSGSNVYTGQFYPVGVPFYNCFYEWWVRVDSSGYVWSDGYGGSHDMLFGFTAGDTTVQISGNMFDEYTGQSFGSWDNMKRGTVHHVSVAFTGTYIITWIDGVPTQRLARTAKRQNVPSSGCGSGYLGGSDHQNAELILFSMRAYEFGLPRYIGDGDCFFPETNFTAANNDVVFCVNEFNPNANMVNDKSSGFYGMKHDGFRNYSVGGDPIYPQRASGVDSLPQYVVDSIVIDSYTGGISSAPVGAKIYDFFERQDQVPAFTGSPTIDSTQGGSLGKKIYIYSMYGGTIYAGIINKYCYFSGSSLQNYAKVLGDSPSQDVRATFSNGTSEVAVDILSNVTDNNNKILARVSNGGQNLNLYKWVGGVFTSLGGYSGTAITEVKLVVSGGTATVYGDGVSRITGSVSDVPSSNYSGFGCNSAYSRVKKFEVY